MRALRTGGLIAVGVAAALAVAGCGESPDPGQPTEALRTVTDATGAEVRVPEDPEKVVTTHYAGTQAAYDLDVMPIGQGAFEPGIVPEDVEAELSEVPVVTSGAEVDVEKIAGLEPDLILVPNITEEDVLLQLEAIAPVYQFTLRGGDRALWDQRVAEVADALNVSERTGELREEFEARQSELADEYAAEIEGKTVGVIDSYEENNFYAWGEDNMTGTLLVPLGFTWLPALNALVEGEELPEATVSTEKIGETFEDADLLFYGTNLREEPGPFMTAVRENALYQQLPAVEAGNEYPIGKTTIAGYTDANYVLDRAEDALQDICG